MLMMRPARCLSKAREKALVQLKAPLRLVFKTVSQSASLIRSNKASRATPALFTRMSTRPASDKIFPAAAAAQRAHFNGDFLGVFGRARYAGDIRAGAGEFQGDGPPDAAARARDHGDLIGQGKHDG